MRLPFASLASVLLVALAVLAAGCEGGGTAQTTPSVSPTATPTTAPTTYNSWAMLAGTPGAWAEYRVTQAGAQPETVRYELIATSPRVIIEFAFNVAADPGTGMPAQQVVAQMVFENEDDYVVYAKLDLGSRFGGTRVVEFDPIAHYEEPSYPMLDVEQRNLFNYDLPGLAGSETVTACGRQYTGTLHLRSLDGKVDSWVTNDGSVPITGLLKASDPGVAVELCDYAFSGAHEDITAQQRAGAVRWEELFLFITFELP